MEQALIESLLNEAESSSLDFKRDQYAFALATDIEKSELLKDVLAFANAWRRTDAYILIGVEEILGGRSKPVGVTQHLDDAALQQFVNSKTNRAVELKYEFVAVDHVQLGVILIPLQERPIVLQKDFGRLNKNAVYIRRGSSTAVADPDEVSKLRIGSGGGLVSPKLTLHGRRVEGRSAHVVLELTNAAGAGSARAPHLSFRILTAAFQPSQWGLDGNGNNGLPRVAQSPQSIDVVFSSDMSVVIHPGTTRQVTLLDYVGAPDRRPGVVALSYQIAAEGMELLKGSLEVTL